MVIRDVAAGGFVWTNGMFADRVGWPHEALCARPLGDWIDASDQAAFQELLDAGAGSMRAGHRCREGAAVVMDWKVRREDHGLVALGVLAGGARPRICPLDNDTARRLPSDLIDDTLADTLRTMARIIEGQHPGRRCSILLLDREGRRVSVGAGPSLPAEYNAAVEGLRIGPFVGSCGTAAYWNEPVAVENIQTEALWRDLRGAAALAGVAACWSHPITSQSGEVLGALALYNDEPSAPTAYECSGLAMASGMVALAIERGRAEQALRASEAALRESEDRFRATFEDANVGIAHVAPDGRWLRLNAKLCSLLGYSAPELQHLRLQDVTHPRDRDASLAQFERALAHEVDTFALDKRYVHRDGSIVWANTTVRLVRAEAGEPEYFIAVIEDISERKRAEDRYRTLYEDNPSMYFTLDPEGLVLSVNKYGAACLGYEVSDLVGTPVTQVFHPDDRERARARLQQTLAASGSVAGWELRKIRKDGSVLWVQEFARVIRGDDGETVVLVVCEDVTERKQANNLVELQSSVLESIASGAELPATLALLCERIEGELSGTRCMVLLLNESGDTIRATSGPNMPPEILGALEGITAETCPGTCAASVFFERQMIVADVEQDPAWAVTLPLAREHGVRASWSTPLRSRTSGVIGALSICHRVPARPSAHDERLMQTATHLAGIATERRRQEEVLRRTQKLESLGLMAGAISHDFNNLLVAMMGQSALALAKAPPRDPARIHIEKAVSAAERAAELTSQLLAYSGRGHFEFRLFDLNQAIEENLHLLDVAIPKSVRIQTDLSPSLPLIEADTGQMQQVFMNLVINAAESIGDRGGRVRIRTTTKRLEPADPRYGQYTNQVLAGGSYVALDVEDDGAGMDPNTLARIFDPFFTTKQTGHGLGLAAVLGVVRGHGGGLAVSSEPGVGTTFSLVFPASGATGIPTAATQAPPTEAVSTGHILVIDDEEAVRDAVMDFLTHAGMRVLRAPGGAAGLELYRRQHAEIDLVVLDLSMPGMSGEETLEHLRALDPDVRVLLSSGYDENEVTRRFVGKRLAGFIQKPYRPDELIEKVRALL